MEAMGCSARSEAAAMLAAKLALGLSPYVQTTYSTSCMATMVEKKRIMKGEKPLNVARTIPRHPTMKERMEVSALQHICRYVIKIA